MGSSVRRSFAGVVVEIVIDGEMSSEDVHKIKT